MMGLEIMLKAIGLSPEVFQQTQQIFLDIATRVQRMEAQLSRIENNTAQLLEMGDGIAPAAPTRYDLMQVLTVLPPFEPPKENENGNVTIAV